MNNKPDPEIDPADPSRTETPKPALTLPIRYSLEATSHRPCHFYRRLSIRYSRIEVINFQCRIGKQNLQSLAYLIKAGIEIENGSRSGFNRTHQPIIFVQTGKIVDKK